MNDKPVYAVRLEGVADSERIIFKLIFSVSCNSPSRPHGYALAEAGTADIVIGPEPAATGGVRVLPLRDADDGRGPCLVRPLIASRVLAALDALVAAPAADGAGEDAGSAAADAAPVVEFSITEEEASELAIVHDESLSNPANESPAASADPAPVATVHPLPGTAEVPRPRALVVDDSASVRKQLELELDLFEVEVDYAAGGEEARGHLAARRYDVAFLDVVMPDADGFDLCKAIKAESPATRVIMLTGKATQADKIKGTLAGCDAYLVKPVGREMFQSTVRRFLQLRQACSAMGA